MTRVANAGYLSDFNNVTVFSLFDEIYSDKFGFTEEEVIMLLGHHKRDMKGVKIWYDGYRATNNISLYNPWSINSFIQKKTLAAHWVNTGKISIILFLLDFSLIHYYNINFIEKYYS